ncbi:hypothetical protein [Sphingobium lactosutens]|uniref:Uncharacterized protein n=1 Tax=Sphingobium lactosutens DS20 TaxID=1331060 RepID=T0H4G4_9SPHN|nr:hypothetical protein [Sphingobium lactosutens]EQB11251.1 hypothetical protein RLDS_22885 [Sphingobium lactosutens DS20]
MNPFKDFPHSDFEVVTPEGEVRESGSGIFTGDTVVVFNEKLQVFANDEIRRRLPNGSDEAFTVVDPVFYQKMMGLEAHFQIKVRRKGTFPHHTGGHFNITVSGENARVNIGSTDNSTNVVNNSGVFADLINAIEGGVENVEQKAVLVEAVKDMEKAKGTGGFAASYAKFMGLAADHIGVVTPFLAPLASMIGG